MSIFVVKKVGDLLTTRQCLGSFVGLVSFFVRHGVKMNVFLRRRRLEKLRVGLVRRFTC